MHPVSIAAPLGTRYYAGVGRLVVSVFLPPNLSARRLARCCARPDDDVPFGGALDAQVWIVRAKLAVVGFVHDLFPLDEHGPFKSLDDHSHDYCSAKDTAAGPLASCVAASGNFSINISRRESTNGATAMGSTEDAKGRVSTA